MDAAFIGFDERWAFGVHHAVDKLGDIALDLTDFSFPALLAGFDPVDADIPKFAEHLIG
ncbi:hypothetical protein [Sphingomonas suaedae]|uniref:hypothetical protein n=1 Tax=Sphingomonas suaedae TaxID=2599297 RepID=UPI001C93761D|nr:hypothetical protein [Sphingomonas suaedae]